jgi:hypothetical protein
MFSGRGPPCRPSYFPHKSHTVLGVMEQEVKLGRAIYPKEIRVGEPNILCCPRLLYIEYPWFPVICFETVFVGGWVGETNLCQNLRASKFKILGDRIFLAPPNHTFILPPIYNVNYKFTTLNIDKNSLTPQSNMWCFVTSLICAVLNFS